MVEKKLGFFSQNEDFFLKSANNSAYGKKKCSLWEKKDRFLPTIVCSAGNQLGCSFRNEYGHQNQKHEFKNNHRKAGYLSQSDDRKPLICSRFSFQKLHPSQVVGVQISSNVSFGF